MAVNQPVLALVSDKLRARLSAMLPQTVFCRSWNELASAIYQDDRSVVVIDPLMCADPACARCLKQRFALTSFIVYSELHPKPFRQVVELVRNGFSDVLLFGYDDDRGRILRLIEEVRFRVPAFADALKPLMDHLPDSLRRAVEEMMREPHGYRGTPDLAAAAQMSTRAVFRHMKQAGFASPRRLVASARAFRAYQLLSHTGRSVHEVAARLRYASADQLCQHFVELTGRTASEVKKGVPMKEFADAIIESIRAPAMAGTADSSRSH